MNEAISVSDLNYRYHDGTEALRGVSFRIDAGRMRRAVGAERLRQIHTAAASQRHSARETRRRPVRILGSQITTGKS